MIDDKEAANSIEALKQLEGEKVKGAIKNKKNTIIIIFDSGYGFEFSTTSGVYWLVKPKEVESIINKTKAELKKTKEELEYVLKMAGE